MNASGRCARFDLAAGSHAPGVHGASLGLDDRSGRQMESTEASPLERLHRDHLPSAVDMRDIEIESHPEAVYVAARLKPEGTVDTFTSQETLAAATRRRRELQRSHRHPIDIQRHLDHGASLDIRAVELRSRAVTTPRSSYVR